MKTARRAGFALLLVLLVVAALELLTLSTLALATHEAVTTNAVERMLVARRAAEAALRRFTSAWPARGATHVAIAGSIAFRDSAGILLTVRRHAWGIYEVTAAAPAGAAPVRAALVLRTLDVQRALDESNAALLAAGRIISSGATFTTADTLACTLPYQPALTPAAVVTVNAQYAFGVAGVVIDSARAVLPAGYALGGVRWDEAASIADSIVTGSYAAIVDSTGSPQARLIYSAGDLTLMPGPAAGILLVDGDLDARPAAEFDGIIVVRGTATLADGVRLSGSLRTQGSGSTILGAAVLTYSRCRCAQALLRTPAGARLIPGRRRFIPAF